jgi:decaprenylphospho-beta-D-erythro-pentofuranosid-2-ulose 2-reductase
MKKIIIVGATSGIAHACAKIWVSDLKEVELTLLVRDEGRGEKVAQDLRVRNPNANVKVMSVNFEDVHLIQKTVNELASNQVLDIVLIAHGVLSDQVACENSLQATNDSLQINGVSPVLFAQEFALHMSKVDYGTLAIIGSVAGDRGRKSNYVYGAPKGLIDIFVQGMQHRFAGRNFQVSLIKPGPTGTAMTEHLKGSTSLASVDDVAAQIVEGLEKRKSVIYAPAKWALIMWIVRHIPNAIFNRLSL